ncbi:TonB-dependent receptor [Portibacter marinus]|uniref:TonB-dependent receptor n=1 Tax=Portibacter marinus TaxID=2898660 RepID=UPI001F19E7EB|nr:TonB-dependent receptor [Portibacter marinus]
MKRNLLVLFLFLGLLGTVMGQTSLEGKITEAESGEPVIFATVALYRGGTIISGTESDLDGNYIFSNIDPGTYDVEVSFIGLATRRENGVIVKNGKSTKLDFALKEEGVVLDGVEIVDYKVPLIDFDNTTSQKTVTSEAIRNIPTRNVNRIAATTAGITSTDGGAISIRGSRSNATDYYVDGIRVSGAAILPASEIEQLQVVTGGLEAKYGDVTGGIISITSKGPSNSFNGGVELETSEYLDAYGYNLANFNLSGPILRNKQGNSVLGFRIAGQYTNNRDAGVTANGFHLLTPDQIAELEENPTFDLDGAMQPTGELLGRGDVTPRAWRPNEGSQSISINGRLDAQLSKAIDISFSGSYNDGINQFAPSTAWAFANWQNNPYAFTDRYRGNFRFRHRLGRQSIDQNKEQTSGTTIRNASYYIQVGIENTQNNQSDVRHGEDYFNYGFYGNQEFNSPAFIGVVEDTSLWNTNTMQELFSNVFFDHIDFNDQNAVGEYIPDTEINPVLAKYQFENGNLLGAANNFWNYYNNVGRVYNVAFKNNNDVYTVNMNAQFDLLPNGSINNRHNIQFGFLYEQRANRSYNINPLQLWQLASQQANAHFTGVDTTSLSGDTTFLMIGGVSYPFATYNRRFEDRPENLFYQSIREQLGVELTDYVNVNGLKPEDLSLEMFSPSELINFRGIGLNYFGYDVYGNQLNSQPSFNDFFTARDENGRRTFPVAANQPIYGAAYLQDKFSYKDLIIRVGVRVDYFDANTKVIEDPYSLYRIETVDEFESRTGMEQPESVGGDYKVYVSGEESTDVVAYRQGDQWFNTNGTATEGNLLFPGGLVFPSYRIPGQNIKSPDFDPNTTFSDYKPQVNFMPRVSFSFPISSDAGFFAHYDVKVQRPPTNNVFTPLNYYFFNDNPGGTVNNPNLKPEKTVDFEVGFQQKVTNSSAIKVSAYYREMRDMIQRRFFLFVPTLTQYQSYGNIDFGTTKGFTFGYDLRRTQNVEFSASYTLQFADGTGSNSNGISTDRGNIRVLLPLSFDERHRFVSSIDYRYGQGKRYNGPSVRGVNLFENTGLNIQAVAVSGQPYTRLRNAEPFGGSGFTGDINGARLPWQFNLDARLDRTFIVGGQGKRRLFINAYIRATNVLNRKNVIGVFPVTGSPTDDGYIVSRFGQDRLRQIATDGKNADNFLAAHNWRLNDINNFTRPRNLILGVITNF